MEFGILQFSFMFRSIPVSNRICFDKEIKRSWRIHQEKLKKLKGSVGKQKPSQFNFLNERAKQGALQQIRNIQVDRQNSILLNKIRQITTKGSKSSYNKMYNDLSECKKRTLHQPYRKRQLVKIVQENQQILKRIQQKKSTYNIRKMQKQRKDVQKNITLLSQFPYKKYPATQTPVNVIIVIYISCGQRPKMQLHDAQKVKVGLGIILKISQQRTQNKLAKVCIQLQPICINNRYFRIEIESIDRSNEKYRIQLKEDQFRGLLQRSFDNSLSNLLNSIQIDRSSEQCFLQYHKSRITNINQSQKQNNLSEFAES